MGGAISVLIAARHPDLVRTLTLVSPAMPDLRPYVSRMSDPRLALAFLPLVGPSVRRRIASEDIDARVGRLLTLCFAEPNRIPECRRQQAAEEFREREMMKWANAALVRSTTGLFRTWVSRSASLWRVVPEISAPTLVVWGAKDRLVTVRKAARTAQLLPRARLLVLPNTGHVAQMERPGTVARAVLGMWERVDEW
jgi:pimeloyl-ACP methyl ester carboxylesterase